MDNPVSMTWIQKSPNATLQFVWNFVKNGPKASVYKDRIVLLKNHFPSNITPHYDRHSKLTSYSIDLFDNLNMIWERCFNPEPSAFYTCRCSDCNIHTSVIPTLIINHKIIGESGFTGLWEALGFYCKLQTSCNNKNCDQLCQVDITYNTQIFIELDVRPDLTFSRGMTGVPIIVGKYEMTPRPKLFIVIQTPALNLMVLCILHYLMTKLLNIHLKISILWSRLCLT
ncbi:uncharacterized protein LOC125501690 [Athalia rosae]|uniref:uncharacterized protein LOC125501690 n=1 Tax=Athalia rosae TaxID=37344 RepID=UPI0020349AB5|nr:uncharacterized protein LOC125501690 [Athalia rosae]